MTDAEKLRKYLADTADPPMFSDQDIEDMIAEYASLEAAAAEGWRIKAASYVGLVDVSEAGASRKMSSLHSQALEQVKYWEGKADTTPGITGVPQTILHTIVRS